MGRSAAHAKSDAVATIISNNSGGGAGDQEEQADKGSEEPWSLGADHCSSSSSTDEGQTWLVMEYCNKGCLQGKGEIEP